MIMKRAIFSLVLSVLCLNLMAQEGVDTTFVAHANPFVNYKYLADPGALVVEACHRKGIRVVPLVGPSSILLAMMASGLNGQSFAFNGYLPVKPPERAKVLKQLERRAQQEQQSQIFIEAPYRNVKLMEQMLQVCGAECRLTVACDITSPEEFIKTLSVAQWRKCGVPDIAKRPTIFIIG